MASATTAPVIARLPFAPLDNPRLQHLASAKNRQNGMLSSKSSTSSFLNSNPCAAITKTPLSPNHNKRASSTFDRSDCENVDPSIERSPSKKAKNHLKPFTFTLTSAQSMPPPSAKPDRLSTPARSSSTTSSLSSPRAPLTAPAGRSPPRKIAGARSQRRTSAPFSRRINPPSFTSRPTATLPFSLDAALSGSLPTNSAPLLPKTAPAPKTWFFEIHEDTPEEDAANLMEHSTLTLDLSSDDESERKERDGRGKENTPPEGYHAPVASRSGEPLTVVPAVVKKSELVRTRVVADEMDDGSRSPLSDLETDSFIPDGLDKDSHVVVDELNGPDVEAPPPPVVDEKVAPAVEVLAHRKDDARGGEIIVWED